MASKKNIKEAISHLCKIINEQACTDITPEVFRLAKFNKDRVTETLWRLLFGLNLFLDTGSFTIAWELTKRDVVFCTKHKLLAKGYQVRDFYRLPANMTCGSREILIAIGWFMSKEKFLRVLLDNCSSLLGECPVLVNEESFTSENLCDKFQNLSRRLKDAVSILDELSWILGNFKLVGNGLYSAENSLVTLVNKVHCVTCGAGNSKGHLSALEIFLLRHPKELQKFQEELEKYNLYLENLLKFAGMQEVFWQWMKSVNEAKLDDNESEVGDLDHDVPDQHDCKTCIEMTQNKARKLSQIQFELQKILDDGNPLHSNANKMLLKYDKTSTVLLKREFCELKEHVQCLCSVETPALSIFNSQKYPEMKQLATSCSVTGYPAKQSELSHARAKINFLERKINDLEVKQTEMRKLHCEVLNDLAAKSQDSLCIPPVGTSKYFELRNK